jgi:predicted aspartyl protease
VPLEVTATGLLLVPVTVADGSAHRFLLDTGAHVSLLTPELAAALGLPTAGARTARGIGEEPFTVTFARDVTLVLGGASLRLSQVGVAPVALAGLPPVGGILGADLFRRFVVELDFAAGRLTLHDPRRWVPPAGAEELRFILREGMPMLPVTITPPGRAPLSARVALDTGFPKLLRLYRSFVDRHRLAAAAPGAPQPRVLHGTSMGGRTSYVETRMAAVVVAGHELRDVMVTLSRELAGNATSDRYDGLLGTAFLRAFRVVIDYPRRRLLLAPATAPSPAAAPG